MIVRRWTGAVPPDKADAYLSLMRNIAIPDYRRTEGNLAAFCLSADRGGYVEVEMLTWWRDMEAVRAFAGDAPHLARYYDFDPEYLLSLPREVLHFDVDAASIDDPELLHGLAGLRERAATKLD